MTSHIHGQVPSLNVSVEIDVSPQLFVTEEFISELPKALRKIGILAHAFWESEAGKRLVSSRRDYQKALSMELLDDRTVQITLGGTHLVGKKNTYVVAVELGGPSFDMKPGFLNSKFVNKKKIPHAIAANLKRWKWKPPLSKWLVIPIHAAPRQVVFSGTKIFRTVHDNLPQSAYQHPGWKGVKIHQDVIKELNNTIIPDVMGPLLETL